MTEKTELLKRWALTTAETYPELWSEDDEKLFQSILTDHQPTFSVGEYYSDGRLVYKMLAIGDESNQYLALTLDLKEQNSRLVKCFWHEYEIKKDKPATAEQIAEFKRAEHFAKYGDKSVKKTLTIPKYLNALALENHINFSQLLQKALREELQ